MTVNEWFTGFVICGFTGQVIVYDFMENKHRNQEKVTICNYLCNSHCSIVVAFFLIPNSTYFHSSFISFSESIYNCLKIPPHYLQVASNVAGFFFGCFRACPIGALLIPRGTDPSIAL